MHSQGNLAIRSRAESLFFEGVAHLSKGDSIEAEVCFREACILHPHFPEALANLALLMEQRGDAEEAELLYRRALALSPQQSNVLANFGTLLARLGRNDEAETCYRQSLEEHPQSPTTLSNLGALLACESRDEEAEACYRSALKMDENHRSALFNLAYVLLKRGCFEEGWRCLESREWYAAYGSMLHCARWQGEPLAGKSLLIVCEAGQGDMIQFARYAATLKERGATRVDVLCHPSLGRLFQSLEGVDRVFALGSLPPEEDSSDSPPWDFWSPPMSLPHFCRTTLASIPAHLPYLSANAQEVRSWHSRLPIAAIKVGLVWKGNPAFENDKYRSISHFELLRPLLSVSNVAFISLQKGAGRSDLDVLRDSPYARAVFDVADELSDFGDTAAVIENLDLVITVDTAVAHLSGALGKRCWVLLPHYKTDWRWLTERSDSPWYPDVVTLFRQGPGETWVPVIERIRQALVELVQRISD